MFAFFQPVPRTSLRTFRYIRPRFRRRMTFGPLFACMVLAQLTNAQTRSLTWRWMNTPCGNVLSCATGCSACNLPDEQDPVLIGTNVVWVGIAICPQPIGAGDNMVFTEGWDLAPREDRMIILAALHLDDLAFSRLTIVHQAWNAPSLRLEVAVCIGLDAPFTVVHDAPVTELVETLSLAELGCSLVPDGNAMGGFRIRLRAYGSTTGAWLIDELRVDTDPCSVGITTGVVSMDGRNPMFDRRTEPVDALGRRVAGRSAAGVYHNGVRKVVVR